MEAFYKFASESPVLTFFLAVVIGNTIYYSVDALADAIRSRREK